MTVNFAIAERSAKTESAAGPVPIGGEYPAAPPVPSSPLVVCAMEASGAASARTNASAETAIMRDCGVCMWGLLPKLFGRR